MEGRRLGNKNPLTALIEETFDALIRDCMFCLPGRVTAFDPKTQLAQIEAGIQRSIQGEPRTMPVISNVPVKFAGNDEWYLFHEITQGTEGLIHFSQRAVDAWLDQGGPAAPNDTRKLSAEDAFFAPGFRSRPNRIPNFKNEGVGLSNYDGSVLIHLTDSGVSVKGDINVETDSVVAGNQEAESYSVGGMDGATGVFQSEDSAQTITVVNGIITEIV